MPGAAWQLCLGGRRLAALPAVPPCLPCPPACPAHTSLVGHQDTQSCGLSLTLAGTGSSMLSPIYTGESSSPPSQHPPSIPLKEGSRKLGVFVASASSTASAGDAGSSLQQGTRRTAAAAPPPPLLQPSAPRVCSWALPARRGQRVTQARGCDR
ncbi:uncharacterized protein WM294_012795 isoform 1-T1 [Sarcoramphus papa]